MLPDWFLKPHPKYGTTYRLLNLVVGLQLFTIVASRGDVLMLGEAYAFGVVWSFVFKALAMLVLRFKEPAPPRVRGAAELPRRQVRRAARHRPDLPGPASASALVNLMTKEVATISGVIFTATFFAVFLGSERAAPPPAAGPPSTTSTSNSSTRSSPRRSARGAWASSKPYRKLVAIRSPHNLAMLEKCLAETDPETTDVVVMTATVHPARQRGLPAHDHRGGPRTC